MGEQKNSYNLGRMKARECFGGGEFLVQREEGERDRLGKCNGY